MLKFTNAQLERLQITRKINIINMWQYSGFCVVSLILILSFKKFDVEYCLMLNQRELIWIML